MCNDFRLSDVDLEAPPRVYTDTPFKFSDSVTAGGKTMNTPGCDMHGAIETQTPQYVDSSNNKDSETTQTIQKRNIRNFMTPKGKNVEYRE